MTDTSSPGQHAPTVCFVVPRRGSVVVRLDEVQAVEADVRDWYLSTHPPTYRVDLVLRGGARITVWEWVVDRSAYRVEQAVDVLALLESARDDACKRVGLAVTLSAQAVVAGEDSSDVTKETRDG